MKLLASKSNERKRKGDKERTDIRSKDKTSHVHSGTSGGSPRFEWVPLFFLPVDKLKSSDRESSTEIHVREEGARRQEWKKNRGNERGIRGEDTNPGNGKREVDTRLTAVGAWEKQRGSAGQRGTRTSVVPTWS